MRRWNPAGRLLSAVGGVAFGSIMGLVMVAWSGSWWYLLFAPPMAIAWYFLWRTWFPYVSRLREKTPP
jgi:hypothetical protein